MTAESASPLTAAAIFVDCRVMLDEAPELATIIEEAAMNIEDYLRTRRHG